MGLEKINIFRKQKGISVEELSKLSGVPLGTLSKITAGITKNPNLETVRSIAYALGCTLDDFDNKPSQSQVLSKDAHLLGQKYDTLDDKGKHTVNTVLDMEYNRVHKPHLVVNAAHEIEGASEEDKQHDDDIMNDF